MRHQLIGKLVDFLKHQPQRPNSKQALVAWIYAFLLKESSSSLFKETVEPIVDASFPIVNPQATDLLAYQTVCISTSEFLLDTILLDGITAKNQTKTVIQTIAQLEAILCYQRRNNMRMAPSGGLPTYLLLLSTDPKVAYGDLQRNHLDSNPMFSMHHGAYYSDNATAFFHGKDLLKLQSTFEFEWRVNHQADYHFCLAEIQLPIDFNQNKYVTNQQTRKTDGKNMRLRHQLQRQQPGDPWELIFLIVGIIGMLLGYDSYSGGGGGGWGGGGGGGYFDWTAFFCDCGSHGEYRWFNLNHCAKIKYERYWLGGNDGFFYPIWHFT